MAQPDSFTEPSFSLNNRFARLLWKMSASIFFRYSPTPFFKWRAFLLRMFGAKVGKGTHVYPYVKIWAPWNLDLGDECGIANGVNLYCQAKIAVGRRTVISQGTNLVAGTHDYSLPGFPLITKPIHLGDHVWIAAEVFVHPGITIGTGSVVGARSVVIKNLPEWMVCTGHPCQPIKRRILKSAIDL